ncbi:MAG: disulfide bond formation protein B [Oxalobacter sp.]|jgi:disulfide bond formation protein DsbB|nr:disulfide bond formation protein B [Oxalobacter sp.]
MDALKNSRNQLLAVAFLCILSIVLALYLQIYEMELPCPLCVLQRYAFIAIAFFCVAAVCLKRIRLFALLGAIASFVGAYLAGYQLWVIAHPSIQCGRDALEEAVNRFFLADLAPVLFKAESLCSDVPQPFMVLNPPQWALVWFVVFAVVLIRLALKKGA